MNQDNFGMAVIPAMAGFFLFGKRAKVQAIQEEKLQQLPAVIKTDTSGQTGVARYLMSSPLVTSVTKYMKKKEKQHITGVAKYVLRQTIAERNAPAKTGVSKYLAKAAKEAPTRKNTSIDKYLFKQELAGKKLFALTGVAKYEAEQNLLERKKAAVAMIQRYREQEEAAAIAAREAAAAAYESSKLSALPTEQDAEEPATTRVGRYLQEQAGRLKKMPKATSVSKYIAQKIASDSQKPAISMSKVSKYLREQALAQSKKPKPTGVAKYLALQQTVIKTTKPKQKIVESGVARYLASQAVAENNKPVLSGVARYMEKQAQLEHKAILSLPDHSQGQLAASVLEGEFIPANDFSASTGVSRYLEKQTAVLTVETESAKGRITGVSRYLDKQSDSSVASTLSSTPTGVERYLLNRAA